MVILVEGMAGFRGNKVVTVCGEGPGQLQDIGEVAGQAQHAGGAVVRPAGGY